MNTNILSSLHLNISKNRIKRSLNSVGSIWMINVTSILDFCQVCIKFLSISYQSDKNLSLNVNYGGRRV